jgi:4-diphosphocytidyl-2-C-methyl-D-erythritol kinase
MGGGLGGGSSNAAVTLLALNDLFDLGYSVDELATKGAVLGADVPVFVRGTSAWAEGIGDELMPLELPACWFVIIYPDCHVSTQEIFGAPELTRNTPPITVAAFFEGPVRNDLQPVVESRYKQVSTAIKWLSNHGSAMMTGSGACVFASFQSQVEAQRVAEAAKGEFSVFVAKGINRFTVV